jgi:hypothetical protein
MQTTQVQASLPHQVHTAIEVEIAPLDLQELELIGGGQATVNTI